MSAFEPMIKEEPVDDDLDILYSKPVASSPLFVPEDDEPAFVDSETVLRRATDKEGRPFPTLCFQMPHLEHPHHHRLICGHDILTERIERCGSNCAISRDKKASGMGFDCPHPNCKKQASHFIRQRNAPKPRKCILSHVYGLYMEADQERMEEKRSIQQANDTMQEITTGSGLVLRPRVQRREPKRSPSLPATLSEGGFRNASSRKKTVDVDIDIGESLNQEFEHDPARDSVMRMTGGRARANGAFKTDKEVSNGGKMLVLTQGMSASQVAAKEKQRTRRKKPLKKFTTSKHRVSDYGDADYGEALREADTEPDVGLQARCGNCGVAISRGYHHCFDCPDFDLCPNCLNSKIQVHPPHHRFKLLDGHYTDQPDGPFAIELSFCSCNTTSTCFLVLCCDCETPFHPGCVGMGAWDQEWYDIDHMSRGSSMKHDYLSWTGGKVYRCVSCQQLFNEANVNVQTSRDIRMLERAKKRQEKAGTQEQTVVEEDQESPEHAKMEVDDYTQERAPSPMPRPRKRVADEVEDEDDFLSGQDEASAEAKRTKFDLPVRSRC